MIHIAERLKSSPRPPFAEGDRARLGRLTSPLLLQLAARRDQGDVHCVALLPSGKERLDREAARQLEPKGLVVDRALDYRPASAE